jgi:pectin methylesterase-like acyl-CoA thioesterase
MAVSSDVQKVVDVQKTPDAIVVTQNVTLVHGGVSTTYSTIQAAVTAAVSGDSINIAAGVYTEQVVVNGISNLAFTAAHRQTSRRRRPRPVVEPSMHC